ncbi:tryptophanyl-tRNA synthetase [Branchiibius hedensis]|uniref:Tryptophan--tRNA ligase n=1 Tax=Branchiibius hedensis TaxID=672460 RepID=A0A2Y8ZPJ2_9MICO|nr:tryptophan--tRNA ligase [Branchiibius hedensis]PWJ25040.1 tryptophanyl-tRNA synthetase [Branchiibius hedensis]SSA33855.1 tryptophanyl-tRNA synthetase [Branchiibius hedensis]
MSTASFQATLDRMPALEQLRADPGDHRVLSGDRPTGPLHLAHLFASIQNRVLLQDSGIETFVLIADYQVITDRETTGQIGSYVRSAVLDYLAAGIDPQRSVIFAHSAVPALNQLLLPFLSLVTEAELHRNPTVKSELAASGRALSGLLLTYPVHQAADILFCDADLVPVGKDNLPHVELTRTIARRFNDRYGVTFRVPEALLTHTPDIPGLDGRKMSKSFGNAINLSMSADETAALIRRTPTDSARVITFDPDNRPGVSGLLSTAALVLGESPEAIAERVHGAAELKALVTESVNDYLAGHRARRDGFARDARLVQDVLHSGNRRANDVAEQALSRVRAAMGMTY